MNTKTIGTKSTSIRFPLIMLVVYLVLPVPMASGKEANPEILVYTARKEHLVKPLFDRYTELTGTKIQYISDKAPALLARLKAEGKRSQADLLFTVDAGNLWHAAKDGLLTALKSKSLSDLVPAHLRDPENRWFALSVRARTIAYHPQRVRPSDIKNYASLAEDKWKKKLCLRTSKKVYNQSLVAMLISQNGQDKTNQIVSGWVKNLATKVFANDAAVIRAIDTGQCDVGIVNNYYYAAELKKTPGLKVKLFWPAAAAGGTHVNVSGAGVLKTSKQPEAAQKLLEWLVSDEAQEIVANLNYEFPIRSSVKFEKVTKNWGLFDHSQTNLIDAGKYQAEAVKLMDKVGYR